MVKRCSIVEGKGCIAVTKHQHWGIGAIHDSVDSAWLLKSRQEGRYGDTVEISRSGGEGGCAEGCGGSSAFRKLGLRLIQLCLTCNSCSNFSLRMQGR